MRSGEKGRTFFFFWIETETQEIDTGYNIT